MNVPAIKDEVWKEIEAILPRPKQRRLSHPGRKPLSDRKVLNGILYILGNGIAFDRLPKKLGYGSGMTAWNRIADWKRARVWSKVQWLLTDGLPDTANWDWGRIDAVNTGRTNKRSR